MRFGVAAAASAALALAAIAAPAEEQAVGQVLEDRLRGGPSRDVISGRRGTDRVRSRGGGGPDLRRPGS